MKRIFLALFLAVVSMSSFAQFQKGTKYINTSLSGFDLGGHDNKFSVGLNATGGYFFEDAWMAYGRLGYDYRNYKGPDNDMNDFQIGAGARYYIHQNGLYLGLGLKYEYDHAPHSSNNYIDLTPEVGYCFYLNHYVSVEPSVYYDLCLNKFSSGSRAGLRVGFGFYF